MNKQDIKKDQLVYYLDKVYKDGHVIGGSVYKAIILQEKIGFPIACEDKCQIKILFNNQVMWVSLDDLYANELPAITASLDILQKAHKYDGETTN